MSVQKIAKLALNKIKKMIMTDLKKNEINVE